MLSKIDTIISIAFFLVNKKGSYNNDVNNLNMGSLKRIVNLTGKSFDWKSITNGNGEATFVTGTIPKSSGNIEVVNHE